MGNVLNRAELGKEFEEILGGDVVADFLVRKRAPRCRKEEGGVGLGGIIIP